MSRFDTSKAAQLVREPSNKGFVPLAEAISWMAYQNALNENNLRRAIEGSYVGAFTRLQTLTKLMRAMQNFTDLASCGKLEVRGRHVTDYWSDVLAAMANSINLTGNQLRDFSQFDCSTVGLRRRPPLQPRIIWNGHRLAFSRTFASENEKAATDGSDGKGCIRGFAEGYRFVEVSRDDLMREFPAEKSTGATRSGGMPSQAKAEREVKRWLEDVLKVAPPSRTKQGFRAEAISKFPGLSNRGFDRAWAQTAPELGRAHAGRKSKR